MATFNYTVDTNPMANEISKVSTQVVGTTAAVVAMRAAVISAEEKAANHVCDNVNKGFFTLIRSQISQKMARLQSDVDSQLMLLNQQRKQLLIIKNRMERDYNRIASRYLKLFNGLNANLRQRVFELDRPTIDFAVKEVERVSNRTKYLTATVPVAQLESLAISQKIMASNVKNRGKKVIDSMTNFLSEMNEQKRLTNRILLPEKPNVDNAVLAVPVVISECNFDKFDNKNVDVFVSKIQLNPSSQMAIKNTITQSVDDMRWQKETDINRDVKSEFSKILSGSNSSQRVKDMASKLFLQNNYETIKTEVL
jgi:hypothetical protein